MERPPPLPLPLTDLPESIRRFVNPDGPVKARMMAARGLVPIRGNDQVSLLLQLSTDTEQSVAKTAFESISKLPDSILLPACEAALHPSLLDQLATYNTDKPEVLSVLVANAHVSSYTIERISRTADELLCERIAVNEQRLLQSPTIIEALYKNRNMRMSTADRLIELAARNNVELNSIPAYKAHVEAIKGQLIPEPSDELLPGDALFKECLERDGDEAAYEQDESEGTEEVKEVYKPLAMRIKDMTQGEKIRLALVGNTVARAILVRDNDKNVALAVVSSPAIVLKEVVDIAKSKDVSEDVLRFIGNRREWLRSGELKSALVFNPRTPIGISVKFISHLRLAELRKLARSKNVASQIRSIAAQWVERRQKM